jgi:hypothetical protein
LQLIALGICEIGGLAGIIASFDVAQTRLTSEAEFVWFWAGMLLLELPLAAMIAYRATKPATRLALVTFFGVITYAPKLLRNPASPLYHDEFAHWRETQSILSSGKLFQPNPLIPIISRYPGLHAATAAMVQASGLTIWQVALLLLILMHVSLVLGIFFLAQSAGLGNRTAGLTVIIYGLNSSFLYFDTQYSYESMAITLLVWALLSYVRSVQSRSVRDRLSWGALTVSFSAGTVVTHHLSAVTLVIIMVLASIFLSIPGISKSTGWVASAVTGWTLTLVSGVILGAWLVFVAPVTLSYLAPYVTSGFSEVTQFVGGHGGGRQLFSESLSPAWERYAAYLAIVFAVCFAAGGLLRLRASVKSEQLPRGANRAIIATTTAFALLYFPSTLFILSPEGAEGARRSWAFSWIGLAILTGPPAVWLLDKAKTFTRRWQPIILRSGLLLALSISLVGGVAAGLDAAYRFPGPFLYGSEARSVTPELLATSSWFRDRFGVGHNIVTDGFTGLVFGSFGLQNPASPSSGFPTYDLYLAKPGTPINPSLIRELRTSHYLYLIIDERVAYDVPEVGVYFEPGEPSSFITDTGKSIFRGRLTKFNDITWMIKVYQSDNYSIYRMNLPITGPAYLVRPPQIRGQLSVRG